MRFSRHRMEEPEINLIPFIDVLLVVLIFLMLSTTYSRYSELQINLPTADAEREFATTGQRNREHAEQESDRQSQGEPGRIDLSQAPVGVTEQGGEIAHGIDRTHDPQTITQPQHHVTVGNQVGVATTDTGHRRTETTLEVEFAQMGAGQRPVRHGDATEVDLLAVECQVSFAANTRPLREMTNGSRRTDHRAEVPGDEHRLVRRDLHHTVLLDPREREQLAVPVAHVAETRQVRSGDLHRPTRRVQRLRLLHGLIAQIIGASHSHAKVVLDMHPPILRR